MKKGMLTSDTTGTWDPLVLNGYSQFLGPADSSLWWYRYITKYSEMEAAIGDNCPIHLMLRFDNNTFSSEGHDVFAYGTVLSTSGTQYIYVIDGWKECGRVVKYSYYPGIKGYKIWVHA